MKKGHRGIGSAYRDQPAESDDAFRESGYAAAGAGGLWIRHEVTFHATATRPARTSEVRLQVSAFHDIRSRRNRDFMRFRAFRDHRLSTSANE